LNKLLRIKILLETINDELDRYNLNRFIQAQKNNYDDAFLEIQRGKKSSHWMWYIFPQFDGLGFSSMSQLYSIKSIAEAEAYLVHPILGVRLRACTEATLAIEGKSVYDIFGSPDDMKLRSSATLFSYISPPNSVFEKLIKKYFDGNSDRKTLTLLSNQYF
jgi:uncharacterized protein (DUF1810 family)